MNQMQMANNTCTAFSALQVDLLLFYIRTTLSLTSPTVNGGDSRLLINSSFASDISTKSRK